MFKFYPQMKLTRMLMMLFVVTLCAQKVVAQQPLYLDKTKTAEERARDLVSRMTLQEKVDQMLNSTPAIPRLDIPAYDWWNEALHGVGRAGVATVFPQAIGLGATFDADLAFRVSDAVSDEARAQYNVASAKGYYNRYNGLTFWTPNVNIFRDPRWGRGQETYGEDPYLTSQLGLAFVRGLQGNDPNYLKTAACAKHFAVHSGPEKLRHEFNAIATKKDLYETYLPAFEVLVTEGDVEAVMCAYNRTNDEPCCSNNYLIKDVLRGKWGFEGHVVSDCWAIVDFFSENGHGAAASEVEAAVMALNSGVNVNCGSTYPALVQAVEQGLVSESIVDEALVKLLETRFDLGMFDDSTPFDHLGPKDINSAEHRALAKEAATKSIVLLKNNDVLPLANDLSMYYVTGPNAASVDALIGNYFGVNTNFVTVLEGIAGAVEPGSQVEYRAGTLLDRPNVNPIDWSSEVAQKADATFMVMGINGFIEGEEGESIASEHFGDRLDYNIPKNQVDYLRKLKDNAKAPVIAIVTGGSPMNLAEVQEIADAVLLVWYPGEEGGNAIADLLFGKAVPSGRLPITFPKSLDQLPDYEDYSMEGRTYKYMKEEPLYPFGFGLSYASFKYENLALTTSKVKKGTDLTFSFSITNQSELDAEEVVQIYLSDVVASVRVPLFDLKKVERVQLKAGETKQISVTLPADVFEIIDNDGNSIVEKGEFKLYVGGSLPTERSLALGASKGLEASVWVK